MFKDFVIGLVKGRHEMPEDIESYVFNDAIVDPTKVETLLDTAIDFMEHNVSDPVETRIIVYVTGLTPALIAVLNAAQLRGVRMIVCKHWNRETNTYFSQVVF